MLAALATPPDPLDQTPYRTISALGHGGMGIVVLAEHRALRKEVVVKLIHRELARPEIIERMRVEGQILARLSHPRIVQVTDMAVTPAGRPYIVMERLTGCTLAEEVAHRGALPVAEAVELTCQILAGLAAAHEAGIVHRDIKPDNVFLHMPRGSAKGIKLLDFGVAKVIAGGAGPLPSRFPTEEGAVMGTPRFCSPEQAMGRLDVDHRADIYGVGALLYFLVTGKRLFADTPNILELLQAHARRPPEPPSAIAMVPPAVDEVVLRALAKSPAARYQTAAEMSDALRNLELRVLPRTVKLPDAVASSSAKRRRLVTDLMPLDDVQAKPVVKANVQRSPGPEPARGLPNQYAEPARTTGGSKRPPVFDQLRFVIVFCLAVLVAGALLIALLRWGR